MLVWSPGRLFCKIYFIDFYKIAIYDLILVSYGLSLDLTGKHIGFW